MNNTLSTVTRLSALVARLEDRSRECDELEQEIAEIRAAYAAEIVADEIPLPELEPIRRNWHAIALADDAAFLASVERFDEAQTELPRYALAM